MNPPISLSICVAAYNEAPTLKGAVNDLQQELSGAVSSLDIIIVNDGSTDDTAAVAARLAEHPDVRVITHAENQGVGAAYRHALSRASGDFFTDFPGDHENRAAELRQALEHVSKELLVTTHHVTTDPRSPFRRWLSRTYTALLNRLKGLNLTYYNGLTIFPTAALKRVTLRASGFFYSAEALIKVLDLGYAIKERDYPLDARSSGESTALSISSLCRAAKDFRHLLFLPFVIAALGALLPCDIHAAEDEMSPPSPRLRRTGRQARHDRSLENSTIPRRSSRAKSRDLLVGNTPFTPDSVEIAKPWSDEWYALPWGSVILKGDELRIVARTESDLPPLPDVLGSAHATIRVFSVAPDGTTNILKSLTLPLTGLNTECTGDHELRIRVPAETLLSHGLLSNEEDSVPIEFCSADSSALASPPVNKSSRNDSDCFDSDQLSVGGLHRGSARGGGDPHATPPESEFTQTFIQAAGVAFFDVTIGGVSSPVRQIQRQCDIFYFSGHARYAENCLYAAELSEPFRGNQVRPEDIAPYWNDVDVAIFATCSILDIGDFNRNFRGNRSPGKSWAATGAEWYLGYNYLSPADNQDGDHNTMGDILHDWHERVRAGATMDDAWRDANTNAQNPNGKRTGLNACAIHVPGDGGARTYSFFRKRWFKDPEWTVVSETDWP